MLTYRNFGKFTGMAGDVDPTEFGQRVRELREELGWSQTKLGKASGFSQSNIGWIEQGSGKPKKYAIALADALQTSPEWLMYGTGKKNLGPRPLTSEQLQELYDTLPVDLQMQITEIAQGATRRKKRA